MPPRTQPSATSAPQEPDLIFHGGSIHALDAAGQRASALALRDGLISALGETAEMLALAGPSTRFIDLQGKCVLPGINDSHLHGIWLGSRWPQLMLESFGEDWHRRELDSRAARREALLRCWRLLASLGITSYTEPGIGPGEDAGVTGCFGSDTLAAYADLARSGEQTVRVTLLRLFGILDGPSRLADLEPGLATPVPEADPRWLSIPGVKIFGDGIPPLRSAWTASPYLDGSHGALLTGNGTAAERRAEFEAMVTIGHRRGLQVAVHATGDETIEAFVATIERLGGAGRLRHYVIHGDLVTPDQMERMRAAGIGLTLQPVIADLTRDWMKQALPAETAARAFPFREIFQGGLRTTLSSDAPVATPDWRCIVAAAAGQLEARGMPVGPSELVELLAMYTRVPAEQDGAEAWKGTLEPGKVADLCILATDPFEAGWRALPAIDVEMTIVGGRVVFDRSVDAA